MGIGVTSRRTIEHESFLALHTGTVGKKVVQRGLAAAARHWRRVPALGALRNSSSAPCAAAQLLRSAAQPRGPRRLRISSALSDLDKARWVGALPTPKCHTLCAPFPGMTQTVASVPWLRSHRRLSPRSHFSRLCPTCCLPRPSFPGLFGPSTTLSIGSSAAAASRGNLIGRRGAGGHQDSLITLSQLSHITSHTNSCHRFGDFFSPPPQVR